MRKHLVRDRRIRWFFLRHQRVRRVVIFWRRHKWIMNTACALAVIPSIYLCASCPCLLTGNPDPQQPVNIESAPTACTVVNIPTVWETTDGGVTDRHRQSSPVKLPDGTASDYRDIFDNFELRQSQDGSTLYLSLRSRPATGFGGYPAAFGVRYSLNHFAFAVNLSGSGNAMRIALRDLRTANDKQWDDANELPVQIVDEPATSEEELSTDDLAKTAPIPSQVPWFVRAQMWGGGGTFSRPRNYASAVFYASRTAGGQIRLWSCSDLGPFLRDIATHGDAYVTVPLNDNARRLMLCRLGSAPARVQPRELPPLPPITDSESDQNF